MEWSWSSWLKDWWRLQERNRDRNSVSPAPRRRRSSRDEDFDEFGVDDYNNYHSHQHDHYESDDIFQQQNDDLNCDDLLDPCDCSMCLNVNNNFILIFDVNLVSFSL